SHPDLRVKGLHEALISEETFSQVQQVLSGRKPTMAARKKLNPNFPLKAFVKCGECGTPLTGGSAKGRHKRYDHYWCRNSACKATKIRREKLEREFLLLLNRLQPNAEAASSFPKIAGRVWAQKQGDANSEVKRLNAKLDDAKLLKSELLKQKLRGDIQQRDYE